MTNQILLKYKEKYGKEPYQHLSVFLKKYQPLCNISSSINTSQDGLSPVEKTNMADTSLEQVQPI